MKHEALTGWNTTVGRVQDVLAWLVGGEQAPVEGTQVPAALHMSVVEQTVGAPVQVPLEHLSPTEEQESGRW